MKLFYSATSPFVRKVMACAVARGIAAQIARVPTDPWESPAALLAQNPLSKVPCLVTDDGVSLFDSPVICEYLDSVGNDAPMFPAQHAARWRALKFQAIGDGMMDAAVAARRELMHPGDSARTAAIARARDVIARGLDALEAAPPATHLDIGSITVACALGYLDLRFADMAWRTGRARLSRWFEAMDALPEMRETAPT